MAVYGGASRASAAEGGGALWRARPKAASPQRALRYRKVLRACSKSERVAYFCGADDSSSSSLLASMDELAAPCPEDSRGSASGLGSERSLIGRPAKPEADKQRSKSWRCTLEAPSEAQQSRLRAFTGVLEAAHSAVHARKLRLSFCGSKQQAATCKQHRVLAARLLRPAAVKTTSSICRLSKHRTTATLRNKWSVSQFRIRESSHGR